MLTLQPKSQAQSVLKMHRELRRRRYHQFWVMFSVDTTSAYLPGSCLSRRCASPQAIMPAEQPMPGHQIQVSSTYTVMSQPSCGPPPAVSNGHQMSCLVMAKCCSAPLKGLCCALYLCALYPWCA